MTDYSDLFGVPRDPGPRGKGRPAHKPTDQNRLKIMLLQAMGKTRKEIATALRISVPTLREHYSSILSNAETARVQEFAGRMARLWEQGAAGNASAFKEYDRLIERELMRGQTDKIRTAAEASNEYVPKSQRQIEKAEQAARESEWSDLVGERTIN